MAEYLTPGVFVEDINQVVNMPVGTDPVSAFVGITATGPVGVPVLINSWNAYLTTFAIGQDSAFLANSYLAYAVYGFFQNGGKKCYILRVSDATTAQGMNQYKATTAQGMSHNSESGTEDFSAIFSAKTEGEWGNNITVYINNVDKELKTFSLKVTYQGEIVESWGSLKAEANVSGCFADVINAESNYIKVTDLTVPAPLEKFKGNDTIVFSQGTDGIATTGNPVPDTVYEVALNQFDFYDEIRLVAIPGASLNLQKAVSAYCTNSKYRIAICDGLSTSTNTELQNLRGSLNGDNAVVYAPWVKVANPLSSNGALISVPVCGHICGIYSRISDSRGFWKSPAGTEAIVRGAVDVQRVLTTAETDILNPKGINAIVPRTNYGIAVWGARSCNPNFAWVSDLYTNITIKKNLYDLTQKFVFEPHDSVLWQKVKTTCQDYLESLYQKGALFGDNSSQAYFVKCDEELNPPSVRNQGKLICEVGYATKKPAEFIIFRISHELTTA